MPAQTFQYHLTLSHYQPLRRVANHHLQYLVCNSGQNYTLNTVDGDSLLVGEVGSEIKSNGIEMFVQALTARSGTEFSLLRVSRIEAISDLQEEIKVSEKGKKTGILRISLDGENPELRILSI